MVAPYIFDCDNKSDNTVASFVAKGVFMEYSSSQTSTIIYCLDRALKFHEQEKYQYRFKDIDVFDEAMLELKRSIIEWPTTALGILDTSNWKINFLVKGEKLLKPEASLFVRMTTKGSLVLDWLPYKIPEFGDSKFIQWTDQSYGWFSPGNRLFAFRNLDFLLPRGGRPTSHAVKYLLEGIHAHVNYVTSALGNLVDLKLMANLYLEYQERKTKRKYDEENVLISCEVLSAEEILRKEFIKWVNVTFKSLFRPED
ncbi:MAG TPA: hypothetical protein DCG53_07745, partial [Syntrophus sp. (in: bacteria)]|nr:hypothetical protein [Syntrophus sp. (in: bacteria)]